MCLIIGSEYIIESRIVITELAYRPIIIVAQDKLVANTRHIVTTEELNQKKHNQFFRSITSSSSDIYSLSKTLRCTNS